MVTRLTVRYRGTVIGTTSAVEQSHHDDESEGIVQQRFEVSRFAPLPGYERVASIVQRAHSTARTLGHLGPAANAQSKAAGDAAWTALEALCAELELYDDEGRLVPARISMVNEWRSNGERRFDLLGTFVLDPACRPNDDSTS